MAKAVDTRGRIYLDGGKFKYKDFDKRDLTSMPYNKPTSCECIPEAFLRPATLWSDGVVEVGFHDCLHRALGGEFRRVYI